MRGRAERQNWMEQTDTGAGDRSRVQSDGGKARSRKWDIISHLKYSAFTLNELRSYQRFKQRTGSDEHTEESLRVENDYKRAKEGRKSTRNCCRVHRPGPAVEATGSTAARLSPAMLRPWVAVFLI